jgi:hypothetical protein
MVYIGRDDTAERKLHSIAAHQLRGWHGLPDSIAADRSIEGETRF